MFFFGETGLNKLHSKWKNSDTKTVIASNPDFHRMHKIFLGYSIYSHKPNVQQIVKTLFCPNLTKKQERQEGREKKISTQKKGATHLHLKVNLKPF